MSPKLWDFIYKRHEDLGFRKPSLLVEDCIIYALSQKFHRKLSKTELKRLRTYKEVGAYAEKVKRIIFIGKAGRSYEDAERDFQKAVNKGIITPEMKKRGLDRLRRTLSKSCNKLDIDQTEEEREERKKRMMAKYGFKPKA